MTERHAAWEAAQLKKLDEIVDHAYRNNSLDWVLANQQRFLRDLRTETEPRNIAIVNEALTRAQSELRKRGQHHLILSQLPDDQREQLKFS